MPLRMVPCPLSMVIINPIDDYAADEIDRCMLNECTMGIALFEQALPRSQE